MDRPTILAVGARDGPLKSIDGVLQRSSLDVHQAPGGWTALSLAASTSPDLLVAGLPLSDMAAEDFMRRLRNGMDTFSHTRVVLLAEEERSDLEPYLDDRHFFFCSDGETDTLEARILELLGVTRRAAKRLLLKFEVVIGAGKVLRLCQSENISESGILVRTDEPYDIGLEVRLEISLPNEAVPVRIKAEVMRHTHPETESVSGLGLRFVQFEGNGQEVLRRYLRAQDPSS